MAYQEHEALPAWAPMEKVENGEAPADALMWSNAKDPPAIGDRVKVRINSIGFGNVVKYISIDGFLGVLVQHEAPPAWYINQNGGNVPGASFGAEIDY